MLSRFVIFLYVVVLGMSYVLVYDLAKTRAQNDCQMDITVRNIQIEMLNRLSKKVRNKIPKFEPVKEPIPNDQSI